MIKLKITANDTALPMYKNKYDAHCLRSLSLEDSRVLKLNVISLAEQK